jgi:exo-beta-1,3-glucanase (GH17 family)
MPPPATDDKHLENTGESALAAKIIAKERSTDMLTGHGKRLYPVIALLCATLMIAAPAGGCGGDSGAGEVEAPSSSTGAGFLFVQEAEGGTLTPGADDSYTLALEGVGTVTVMFTGRPMRQATIMSTAQFISQWDEMFADDPPNAALTFQDAGGGGINTAVFNISRPVYDEENGILAYFAYDLLLGDGAAVETAQGEGLAELPGTFGPASLFIDSADPSGSPAAKMHYGLCLGLWAQPRQPWQASEQWIEQCISTVAPYTEWIATYDVSKTKGTYNVPAIARKHGLKVAACAYITRDEAQNQEELGNLVALVRSGVVDQAIVGNEPLCQPGVTVDMMVRYINQVKGAVAGTGVKVGTREVWGVVCGEVHKPVVDACEVVQITAYPATDLKPVEQAAAMLLTDPTQYYGKVLSTMKGWYGNDLGGRELAIGETGWPSKGAANPGQFNLKNAAQYHRQVLDLARKNNIKVFYFEAFDEDWKAPNYDHENLDANWGIWTWQNGRFVPKQGMLQ